MAEPRTQLHRDAGVAEAKNIYTAAKIKANEEGKSMPDFTTWFQQEKDIIRAMDNMDRRNAGADIPAR